MPEYLGLEQAYQGTDRTATRFAHLWPRIALSDGYLLTLQHVVDSRLAEVSRPRTEPVSGADRLTPAHTIADTTSSGNHYIGATIDWNRAENGYRLPTEAEWEYACRATSTTAFCNGDITNVDCSPLDPNLDQVGWYCGNASSTTHDVGGKAANLWDLNDMHGNLSEWCWDRAGTYGGDVTDPAGPESGSTRVVRGGSWSDEQQARMCRSASRGLVLGVPDTTCNWIGLRLARTVPDSTGSCCVSTGTWTLTTQASCIGAWLAGSVCVPNPCPQPTTGACCALDGACTITEQTACTDPNAWQGQGVACTPDPCAVSGVDDVPLATKLGFRVVPTPFTERTALVFVGPKGTTAELLIFDVSGRRVRSAWRGVLDGRTKKLEWDGRDDGGREVPTWVYFARLRSGSGKVVVKLVRAR